MESIISALNTMAVWEHERVEENISDEHVLPHAKAQFKRRNFPAPNLILIDVWINWQLNLGRPMNRGRDVHMGIATVERLSFKRRTLLSLMQTLP